jgi:hypothetical protein
MTTNTYEADGIRFDVLVTGASVPTLAWAAVHARFLAGSAVYAGTAQVEGSTVQVAFGPWVLPPGEFTVQVRAGATEAASQTVYDAVWTVLDNVSPKP